MQFEINHDFTPIFHPADVIESPPHYWAAAIDWQALKPVFAAQIESITKQKLKDTDSAAEVTGDFLYAWGLKKDNQPQGFADPWPMGNSNSADLDVTCPIHVQGHDGHLYMQAAFSSASRNHMKINAMLKVHAWSVWRDVNPLELTVPLGGFNFDSNVLLLDKIRTDDRGVVLQGAALFQMPLLFPLPHLYVGVFFWTYENACHAETECQMLGV